MLGRARTARGSLPWHPSSGSHEVPLLPRECRTDTRMVPVRHSCRLAKPVETTEHAQIYEGAEAFSNA